MLDLNETVKSLNSALRQYAITLGVQSSAYQNLLATLEGSLPNGGQLYKSKSGYIQIRNTKTAREERYALETDYERALKAAKNQAEQQGTASQIANRLLGTNLSNRQLLRRREEIQKQALKEFTSKGLSAGFYAGLEDFTNNSIREDIKDKLRSSRGKTTEERARIYDEAEDMYIDALESGEAYLTKSARNTNGGTTISDAKFRR